MLRNPQLRKNVAHAIDVIQAKRGKLVAEKTDWQELRAAASAIRAHVLENLGAYLEQFEARCTAAGGHVHWAADAAEARRIILDLLAGRKRHRSHQDQDHDLGRDSIESLSPGRGRQRL